MDKKLRIKIIAIAIGALAAVSGIAAAVKLTKGPEAYRSILIYELQGTALIDRQESGTLNASANLYLESGDRITVGEDSFMRLRLDEDKYVMVEENTILSVDAAGTEADSKTTIRLEQGAITNEIQQPLSQNSMFEIAAPNSVMAVRGTIFRMEVCPDGENETNTKLSVYEGKVSSRLILPDGTMGGEVIAEAGQELVVHSAGGQAGYQSGPEAIRFDELSAQSLEVLLDLMENGLTVDGMDGEAIEKLIEEKKEENSTENTQADGPEKAEPVENTTDSVRLQEQSGSQENEQTAEDGKASGRKQQTDGSKAPGSAQTFAAAQAAPPAAETAGKSAQSNKTTDVSGKSGSSSGGTSTGSGDSKDNGSDTSTGGGNSSGNGSGSSSQKPDQPSKPEIKTCKVTFRYQERVFGTQWIEYGKKAEQPKLKPQEEGSWDFDFSKEIKEDTVIDWKP